jgi:hypothetical protein
MSIGTLLARARAKHESLMTTTVTVKRATAGGTFNDATLTYTSGAGTTVYTGVCHLRPIPGIAPEEAGTVISNRYVVKFPADTDIRRGDVVSVTASPLDTLLVGSTLWVLSSSLDEWRTARHTECADQSPEVIA